MKNKGLLVIIMMLLGLQGLIAQFYETGQPPASLKWRQINTGNFRLVFPESFEPKASELAGILEEARELTGYSLSHHPAALPVIVHNHTASSNGLVVWAPRRMELYTTSPQTIRGGHWLTQLAVHEQRHVVQIDKLDQGVLRFFYLFLGEQAVGASTGRIPEWFYEGDAVVAETALTMAGRGRTPSFYMPMRTLLLSTRKNYGYDKYLHGSFRDYVPDRYQYGYQMVSALRREYGPGIWENTIDNTARRPYYLAPFYRSIRHDTGKGMTGVHENTIARIGNEWNSIQQLFDHEGYEKINRRDVSLYLNYRYPVWTGNSSLIALKSGIAQVNELVRIDLDGSEEHLFYPGPLSSPVLAHSGSRVAWSEFRPDLRWGLSNYSVIRILDYRTGNSRYVSSRSRYFSPAFDPGGLFLAVVETGYHNNDHIVLLNSVTGEAAASYDAPEGKNLQQPVFSADGSRILVTAVCREGTSILSLDKETGLWTVLREPSFENISGVFPCRELTCFHSDISGIDNLYAMDYKEGILYRVTSSGSGAFDGALNATGENLVWSEYTVNGFDLATTQFDPSSLKEQNARGSFHKEVLESLIAHEEGIMGSEEYDSSGWQFEKYRKGLNLFRFHSWAPFYYDYNELNIEQLPVTPGFTLLSQNLLNTANTFLGYSYLNGRHITSGSFIYKGWYPVLETSFDYGDEPLVFPGRDTTGLTAPSGGSRMNLNGIVSLPLNLSYGRYIAGIEPRLRISYDNSFYHDPEEDSYERGMATVTSRFLAYRYTRGSLRDLAPRWGQVIRLQRRSAPFESENLGTISAAELTLYFPGLLPHHSLKIEGAIQWQDPVRYYFANIVTLPRGYVQQPGEDLQLLKTSYSFPFLYPDASIPLPGVIYLKRLHATLFADAGKGSMVTVNNDNGIAGSEQESLFSWGGTVTTNLYVLRAPFPVNISTGFAHIPGRDKITFLFSFGLDIASF
jgi:hypothetical protein